MTDKPSTSSEQQPSRDRAEHFVAWASANRRSLGFGVAMLIAVAGGIWFVREYKIRTGVAAQSALDAARISVQAENYPLAASDLSRLIDSYRGTAAAEEATVLLGQVRLLQGQPDVAAQELQAVVELGVSDEFRAATYGLLGVALEDAGNPVEAAEAYRQASESAAWDFLKAQYLVDAGRAARTAGDTALAASYYDRVLTDHAESPSATEARVRLGELGRTGHD